MKFFRHEANILYNRLLARGYSRSCLKKAFKKAQGKSRDAVLLSEPKKKDSNTVRFITTYSDQHEQIRRIMQKHWHLLSADPILTKYLGVNPDITLRLSGSIRDRLVQSQYKKPQNKQCDRPGLFQCGACDYWHLLIEGPSVPLPNGRIHTIHHRITCQTKGIYIYYSFWNLLH